MNRKAPKDPLTLRDILPYEIPPLFRRQHLNRDFILGIVGDIGAGKSIGGGQVVLLDYLLQGDPCFCNMQLKATLDIDDEAAGKYGLKGGSVTYEALPLDKHKFLRFDPEYSGGVFFTHEFNIWLADARRSTSNLNLETNDVVQELRKLKSAWIYDCVHEMFVDLRVREATDIFIQTSDTALTPDGMALKQKQGIEFCWWITPMTQKGAAIMRSEKGKHIGPYYIRGKQLWGIIDTEKKERREKYKTQIGLVDATEDAAIVAERDTWGWLQDKAIEVRQWCIENMVKTIKSSDMLRIIGRPLTRAARDRLPSYGISFDHGIQEYSVDTYILSKGARAPAVT